MPGTVPARSGRIPDRAGVGPLLEDLPDLVAERIAAFVETFPAGRALRWSRDLAAELLHYSDPERYPLMVRWVWAQHARKQ